MSYVMDSSLNTETTNYLLNRYVNNLSRSTDASLIPEPTNPNAPSKLDIDFCSIESKLVFQRYGGKKIHVVSKLKPAMHLSQAICFWFRALFYDVGSTVTNSKLSRKYR